MEDRSRNNWKPYQQQCYEIRFKGQLNDQWKEWFGGMTLTHEEDDITLLFGLVTDQAALHGLLKKIRDLGLTLISVNPCQTKNFESSMNKKENE